MKSRVRILAALAVVGVAMLWVATPQASAIKQFSDEFNALYTDVDGADEAFVELVDDARCYVCHQGRSKKNRNPYGEKLAELLDKGDDKDDVDKIQDALKKVAAMKVAEDSEEAFGDRISAGKLPGGTLEECKEEPAE